MTYKLRGDLTIKQERFVRAYLKGGNASAAYREAYVTNGMADTTVNREAHELLHNHKVAARVDELDGQAAAVAGLDKTAVLAGLLDTAAKAATWEQAGPMARCWELIGKAVAGGMFTDRHQVGQETLDHEQLIEQIAEGDPERRAMAEKLFPKIPLNFEEAANEDTKRRFRSAGAG